MSLIIDLVIIVSAIISVVLGVKRGFVKSVMSFASILLAVIAVYLFTAPTAAILNEKYIGKYLDEAVSEQITQILSAGVGKIDLEKLIDERPDALEEIAKRFNVDLDSIAEYYSEKLADLTDAEAINGISEHISSPAATAISQILAAIAIFVVTLIVLKLLSLVLDLIFKLPVLKTLNSILGLIFGIASALLSTYILANLAFGLVGALGAINPELFNESAINGSVVLKYFVENNLILMK